MGEKTRDLEQGIAAVLIDSFGMNMGADRGTRYVEGIKKKEKNTLTEVVVEIEI